MIKLLLLCAAFCSASVVVAAELTAKITFTKRPAFSGVAYLANAEEGDAQKVDQKDKKFTQKLFVSPGAKPVVFQNSDSMDHNIYANSPADGVKFDVGLLPPGSHAEVDTSNWKEGALIRVGCKIHPKMKSYIANVSSSESHVIPFQKGQKEYRLSFSDLEGPQPFVLQMPGYDTIRVELMEGESKTLELVRKKKVKGSIELSYQ